MTQWIELSRSAFQHNLSALQQAFPQQACWPCLKSNAYGHGVKEVAQILADQPSGYAVVSTTEALQLRSYTDRPIMVLNIVEPSEILACLTQNIVLPLASTEQAQWYAEQQKPVPVHLEIDTGMARTGFSWASPDEMEQFVQALSKNIMITGIFSHYAAAGEDHWYTKEQYERFLPFVERLQSLVDGQLMVHIDKSASALMEQYHFSPHVTTAFRPGIAVYGFDPEWGVVSRLKPALTWKTKILSLRTVHRGDPVGYGLTFTALRDTQIATLPVGYADGYDRSLSNKASVLVRGSRCPVRGRICMNLTMIEVPPHVELGDEVVLIGEQGEEYISASEVAGWADTTMYEIVTRLSPMIPRQVVA